MAKQLFPLCEKVIIKTVQISRKQNEEGGDWSSYAVIMGEALAADGTKLQDIHEKLQISSGPDPWTADTLGAEIKGVGDMLKASVKTITDEKTL